LWCHHGYMNKTARIGDRVVGKYRNVKSEQVAFIGIVTSGDMNGGLNVDFETLVEFRPGDARKSSYFDAREQEIADIRVIEEQVIPCRESAWIQGHIVRVA
jgi:hypothetical protein